MPQVANNGPDERRNPFKRPSEAFQTPPGALFCCPWADLGVLRALGRRFGVVEEHLGTISKPI